MTIQHFGLTVIRNQVKYDSFGEIHPENIQIISSQTSPVMEYVCISARMRLACVFWRGITWNGYGWQISNDVWR